MLSEHPNPSSIPFSKIDGLMAEQLLSHLREERASLTSMLQAVRDVHYSLLVLDDHSLKSSLDAEERELKMNTALQQRRRQLQGQFASSLQLTPRDITLHRLAAMTSGSLHDSIGEILQSLAEMAAEVDKLNRQNAAMIGQSLAIARGVIEQLTGSAAINESYNSIGGRAETHVGPLIQWGG
jgi:hypothetical protein